MFYELNEQNVANISIILSLAEVKGKDAVKVVGIRQLLRERANHPYYDLDDGLRNFLLETIDNVTIKGEFAFAVVAIQIALAASKGHKELPKPQKKVDKKKRGVGPPAPTT